MSMLQSVAWILTAVNLLLFKYIWASFKQAGLGAECNQPTAAQAHYRLTAKVFILNIVWLLQPVQKSVVLWLS